VITITGKVSQEFASANDRSATAASQSNRAIVPGTR
jgi:hypothetical protein